MQVSDVELRLGRQYVLLDLVKAEEDLFSLEARGDLVVDFFLEHGHNILFLLTLAKVDILVGIVVVDVAQLRLHRVEFLVILVNGITGRSCWW